MDTMVPVTTSKPLDIIAEELWDHETPYDAAEDVIAALEDAGWYLVFAPSDVQDK